MLICFFVSLFNNHAFSSKIINKQILNLSDTQVSLFLNELRGVCKSSTFYKNLNKKFDNKFGDANEWKRKCLTLKKKISAKEIKKYLIQNFKFKKIENTSGLLTGYYEPVIRVSRKRNDVYKFPILSKNKNYINKPRMFIEKNFKKKDVILWTDDEVNLFFLHIQGSGIGEFENSEKVKLVYGGNNGMSYTSIGKLLIRKKYISNDNVNLFTIKEWLRANPDLSEEILNQNKRFIFFKEMSFAIGKQPIGAFGAPLVPNYSVAVDTNIYPLGLPFFIQMEKDKSIMPVVSLDTGGAIIGANRADLFLGRGEVAERQAGTLKKKIYLHAFIPYSN